MLQQISLKPKKLATTKLSRIPFHQSPALLFLSLSLSLSPFIHSLQSLAHLFSLLQLQTKDNATTITTTKPLPPSKNKLSNSFESCATYLIY
jgi:hypothetical protein